MPRRAPVLELLLTCLAVVPQERQAPESRPADAATAQAAWQASQATHGDQHLATATARVALAEALFRAGRLADADAHAAAVLALPEPVLPGADLLRMRGLVVRGAVAARSRRVQDSLEPYEQALALGRKLLPAHAPLLMQVRLSLGSSLMALRDYAGAVALVEPELEALRQAVGRDALSVVNLEALAGMAAVWIGQHAKAAAWLEHAREVFLRHHGPDHDDTVRVRCHLGEALCGSGRATEGLAELDAVLPAMGRSPRLQRLAPYFVCSRAVRRYQHRNDPGTEVECARALAVAQSLPDARERLHMQLMLLSILPGHESRDAILAQAGEQVRTWEAEGVVNRARHAATLANLGLFAWRAQDYSGATDYYQRALDQLDAQPWAHTMDRNRILLGLADCRAQGADPQQAVPLLTDVLRSLSRLLEGCLPSLSEQERIELAGTAQAALDRLLTLAPAGPAGELWYTVLHWKSLVARGLGQQLRWLQHTTDPRTTTLRAEVEALTTQLASLMRQGASAERLQRQRAELQAATRALSTRLAEPHVLPPPVAAIQARLGADEVLIDFVACSTCRKGYEPEPGSERLMAFVLQRDQAPELLRLGPLAEITAANTAYLQVLARWTQARVGDPALVRQLGSRLAALLWQPLADRVQGRRRVWIAPDAAIATVPFAALPVAGSERWLVEDHELVQLQYAGVLAAAPAASAAGTLCLVGDVDYGPLVAAATPDATVAPRSSSPGRFQPLPATAAEIDALATLASRLRPQMTQVVLRRAQATTGALRSALPMAAFVHLATHGFTLAAAERPAAAALRFGFLPPAGSGLPRATLESPGLMAGVAMASANTRTAGADADGVLTAEELLWLPLGQCRLAVLSACETGLGTRAAGEGLLGLRRNTALAGARAVLSSLWRVEDAATRDLMIAFYQELWQRDCDPGAALAAAQRALLARARAQHGEALAGTWGGFVVDGR